MKNFKKLAALVLAMALMLSIFAGCSKPEEENSGMPEFVYVPTYTKVEFEQTPEWVDRLLFADGRFYIVAQVSEEGEPVTNEDGSTYTPWISVQKLISFDETGNDIKELANVGQSGFWSQEESYSEYIYGMAKTENGIELIINKTHTVYNVPENFDWETGDYWQYYETTNEYCLVEIGEDGTVGEEKILISSVSDMNTDNSFYVNYCARGGNGNWYLASWDKIIAFDSEGKEVYRIEDSVNVNSFTTLKDGSVAALLWAENGMEVKVIDDSKKALGDAFTLPNNVYSICSGGGVYDFIYPSNNGNSLYAYNMETGESELIVNWLDSDVDSSSVYAERIFIRDAENIIALEENWRDGSGTIYNIISLKKTPSAEIGEKKILNLACIYLGYDLRQRVLDFNRTNGEYRIRVTDYSEYASGDDYYGLTKLNTEIISGNIPDIFVTQNMPMDRFAGKGIFEDLAPYIERDIGWDNLVEPVFKALMNDEGKLYEIHPTFGVSTYVGLKNIVGDGSSWTFEDLKEAFAKLPEGATVFEDDTIKSTAFSLLFMNSIDSFVDWEKGECNFNSEEFIDILEFTENFPLTFEYTDDYYMYNRMPIVKVAKGEQLLTSIYMYNVSYVRSRTFYMYGDNTAFVGLPTNEGRGSSFVLSSGFAMSSKCEEKEAAWDFISYILSEDYQTKDYYGDLPTNKAAFDKMIEQEMTPTFSEYYDPSQNMYGQTEPAEGEGASAENAFQLPDYVKGQVNEQGWHEEPKNWGYVEDGGVYYEYPVYAMTQQEYDMIMDLINNTTKINRYDDSVLKIVNEEIEYFFNGDRSAQQTAEYIQSRVNLYVNEQR